MTQDEIIEMWSKAWPDKGTFVRASAQDLEDFAKLVDAKATAKEREACAKVCDNKQYVHPYHDLGTLIRARGEA